MPRPPRRGAALAPGGICLLSSLLGSHAYSAAPQLVTLPARAAAVARGVSRAAAAPHGQSPVLEGPHLHDRRHEAPVHLLRGDQGPLIPPLDAILNATGISIDANKSAADVQGVKMNSAEDFEAFEKALVMNTCILVGCFAIFCVLRVLLPRVYSGNVVRGIVPAEAAPLGSCLGWLKGTLSSTTLGVHGVIGLDSALFVEFQNLGMLICILICVPWALVLVPLNYFQGGNAAKGDPLNQWSMSNVKFHHKWMYFVQAAAVWFVVVIVQRQVFTYQKRFLELRFNWLKRMPAPESTTVMVERIPEEYRSDAKLHEMFSKLGKVKQASVVKQTGKLQWLLGLRKAAEEGRRQALENKAPRGKSLDFYDSEVRRLTSEALKERVRVSLQGSAVGGINGNAGFVTFYSKRPAGFAQLVRYSANDLEWRVSLPPPVADVQWETLKESDRYEFPLLVLGLSCIFLIYILFLPITVFITNLSAIDLQQKFGERVAEWAQPYWDAYAPTMGLMIFNSFLPKILLVIFRYFFPLKSDRWAQLQLQNYYFWLLVFFVILVTALGNSIIDFFKEVIEDPYSIFKKLAQGLPNATNFYLNYIILQWTTEGLQLLRYPILGGYLLRRMFYSSDEALELSEPEDQELNGIGARGATSTINLLIGIIFSTVQPLIVPLTFAYFLFSRLIYGYLIVCAEKVKEDLGGAFWVMQLRHVQQGVFIYCLLMTGVIAIKSGGGPATGLTFLTIPFWIYSYWKFHVELGWERLPLDELTQRDAEEECIAPPGKDQVYVQPDLAEALDQP